MGTSRGKYCSISGDHVLVQVDIIEPRVEARVFGDCEKGMVCLVGDDRSHIMLSIEVVGKSWRETGSAWWRRMKALGEQGTSLCS